MPVGWPLDVRPYKARHSVALELGEKGIDLAHASLLRHKDPGMTRKQGASEAFAGRFDGWKAPGPEAPIADLAELPADGGSHWFG